MGSQWVGHDPTTKHSTHHFVTSDFPLGHHSVFCLFFGQGFFVFIYLFIWKYMKFYEFGFCLSDEKLWCWRRLLRVSWTAKRSNKSILKEISPGCSLEGLMMKLKLQYFGHLIRRTDSFEKTLMLGKIEGRRSRGQRQMRWLDGITNTMDMG